MRRYRRSYLPAGCILVVGGFYAPRALGAGAIVCLLVGLLVGLWYAMIVCPAKLIAWSFGRPDRWRAAVPVMMILVWLWIAYA